MDLFNVLAASEVNWGLGFAAGLAALGAGVGILGAGYGISKIAASSVESMARQPEAAGDIRNAMILTAALIEGVAFFGVYVCMSTSGGLVGQITEIVKKLAG